MLQEYLKQLKKPSTDIYKINNLTSAFTNTYNNTRCPACSLLSLPEIDSIMCLQIPGRQSDRVGPPPC